MFAAQPHDQFAAAGRTGNGSLDRVHRRRRVSGQRNRRQRMDPVDEGRFGVVVAVVEL
jgi:hypothetical protein